MGTDGDVERPSTLATGSQPSPQGSKSRSPWNGCCLGGVVVATLLTAAGVAVVLWWFHSVHTRTHPTEHVQGDLMKSFVSVGCGDTISGTGCVSRPGPSYVSKAGLGQHFYLSVISDEDKRDTVFSELATNPGKSIFGDLGYQVNGFGGIFTYEVVQVDPDPPTEVSENGSKVRLYGLRTPESYDDRWFVDERTWNTAGSWEDYSNSVALTCWNFTMAIRCDVEMGAKLVVGSGAWRNTTKGASACDFFPPERGIRSLQTADPSILQYIMNPTKEDNVKSKGGCCVAPVAYDDVSKSFDKGCDPIDLTQGLRLLGAAPDLSVYPRLRALQEHHRY